MQHLVLITLRYILCESVVFRYYSKDSGVCSERISKRFGSHAGNASHLCNSLCILEVLLKQAFDENLQGPEDTKILK